MTNLATVFPDEYPALFARAVLLLALAVATLPVLLNPGRQYHRLALRDPGGRNRTKELSRIFRRLNTLNRECRDITFTARSIIRVNLDGGTGGSLPVIKGTVGFRTEPGTNGRGWRRGESFFTILPISRLDWALRASDILEPVFTGSRDAVFRVRLAALEDRISAVPAEARTT